MNWPWLGKFTKGNIHPQAWCLIKTRKIYMVGKESLENILHFHSFPLDQNKGASKVLAHEQERIQIFTQSIPPWNHCCKYGKQLLLKTGPWCGHLWGTHVCSRWECTLSEYFLGFLTLLSTISKFFNTHGMTDTHLALQHQKQTAH